MATAQGQDHKHNHEGNTNASGSTNKPQFTKQSQSILSKTMDIAKANGQTTEPLHLFLILLCGPEVNLDQLQEYVPAQPSYLWKAAKALEIDTNKLAQSAKERLSSPPRAPPTPPEPQQNGRSVGAPPQKDRHGFFGRSKKSAGKQPETLRPPTPDSPSRPETPAPNGDMLKIFEDAMGFTYENVPNDLYISPFHLSLAVVKNKDISDLLTQHQTSEVEFSREVRDLKVAMVTSEDDRGFPYLSRYATDMLVMARTNKLDETIGRDDEIRRLMQILCRRTKNSAILLGEAGVGKTAVVEGLARRLADQQVPNTLKGTLFSLDLGSLFAGAGKGEYEERVKGVINDVKKSQETGSPVILFIDEIHLLCVGKGSSNQSGMDAANLLKPELARGQFQCIGATTLSEYREYIEKDGALTRRFAQVMVNEPTPDQAITILRGVRDRYENHHRVWVMDGAIVAAVNLAHRYLTARRLPDSAFDLMDEACASSRLLHDLEPEDLEKVKQAEKEKVTYIQALKRDDQKDCDDALLEAEKDLAELQRKSKAMEREQAEVKKHWESIAAHRHKIAVKREELIRARSEPRPSEKKISQLSRELQTLREYLVELEKPRDDINVADGQRVLPSSPDIITQDNIAVVVEKATKIPVRQLLSSDKKRLLDVHNALKKKVKGQSEAVDAIANAIQISRTGLGNANRPIACFLFTGPSGTGKTLISKSLAEEMFGQSTAMVRIDGSEYSQSHSVSRLIGAPPGYVGYDQGGQLTEYVRRTPYCIVLLDEIEKACFEFWTLFLQVMDEGRLTDGQGRLVDFRNTVIIMTSNVGADILSRSGGVISQETKDAVTRKFIERGLPLEFINRIDEVVMFKPMDRDVMKEILKQQVEELRQRDGLKNIKLQLADDAEAWLIGKATSKEYGARLLARVLQAQVVKPLALAILKQQVTENKTVFVRVSPDQQGLRLDCV